MAKKTYKTTTNIRFLFEQWRALEDNKEKILKSGWFFNRVSMKDRIFYLKETARAYSNLWEDVYGEYPELKEKTLSISRMKIVVLED